MKKKSTANKPNKTNKNSKPRSFKIVNILGIGLFLGLFFYLYKPLSFVQDDAYITFRYVKNFITGNGLVFNPGEYVEGYTNFLWLLLLSLTSILGFGIEQTSLNLSVFFGLSAIILTYKLTSAVFKSSRQNNIFFKDSIFLLIPAGLLVLTGSFGYWAVSGMETSLFISLILASIYFYFKTENQKTNFILPSLLFLTFLLRPEGILISFLIYSHKLFYILFKDKETRKTGLKFFFTEVAVLLTPALLYTLFRLLYFGYPFPNTYYAKSGFSFSYLTVGLEYFIRFCKAYMLYGVLLVIPIYLIIRSQVDRNITFLFYFILSYSAATIFLGGDVLSFYRFLIPVAPVIYLLFTLSVLSFWESISEKNPGINKILLVIICMLLLFSPGIYNFINERQDLKDGRIKEVSLVEKMKMKADWLNNKQFSSNKPLSVAATTIGALSYFSDVKVIDMLGLTDEFISHNPKEIAQISINSTVGWKEKKYNAEYVLSRKPDYIIFSTGIKPSAYAERALFATPDFYLEYYPEQIFSSFERTTFIVYSRRDKFENKLTDTSGNTIKINYEFINHYIAAVDLLEKYESSRDAAIADELMDECKKANEHCPSNFGDVYRIVGRYFYLINDIEKAKISLLKSVQIDDMSSVSHAGLYGIFMKEKNLQAAQFHFNKMIRYSPDMIPK